MKNPAVSIIIVNYNTWDVLNDCLNSVKEKTIDIDYELIIVDNQSSDDSVEMILKKYPEFRLIQSPENLGFGRANNLAAEQAAGKYLFFLNPDTVLLNNAVKILYDYMESHADTGICGGNLFDTELQPVNSFYKMNYLVLECSTIINMRLKMGFNDTNYPIEVKCIVGADLMISRMLFEQIKGFDPAFFMYFEEFDLCYRGIKKGYKIFSIPEAKIMHIHGASAENKNEELKKWSYQEWWYSKFIFITKIKGKYCSLLIYYSHLFRQECASIFYSIKKDKVKLAYWQTKSQVIRNSYKRYKNPTFNLE